MATFLASEMAWVCHMIFFPTATFQNHSRQFCFLKQQKQILDIINDMLIVCFEGSQPTQSGTKFISTFIFLGLFVVCLFQVCEYSINIQFQEFYMIYPSLYCECQLHYRASSRASYHLQGKYIQKIHNPSYYTLPYLN